MPSNTSVRAPFSCPLSFATDAFSGEWRRGIAEHLVDNMQDIYDFFISGIEAFQVSPLYRLITVIQLHMRDQLLEVAHKSLHLWLDFVKENTGEENNATPLFKVTLLAREGNVVLGPSISALQSALLSVVRRLTSSVSSFQNITPDLMTLLKLESRPLFNIGNGDPLCQETDALIQSVEHDITERLLEAVKGPMELAQLYEKHVAILAIETDQYVDDFGKPRPLLVQNDDGKNEPTMVAPTLDEYRVKVKEFFDIAAKIELTSYDFEDYSIVRVDCREIKSRLSNKAREIGKGLLDAIVLEVKRRNDAIVSRYESILETISQTPIDEKELQELKQFIASCTRIVAEQEAEVRQLHTNLRLVQEFGHRITFEDFALAWSTKQWPKRVQKAAENCELVLENDKIRMMDKLALEKEAFEADLEAYEARVDEFKTLEDISNTHKYKLLADNMQDALVDAEAKVVLLILVVGGVVVVSFFVWFLFRVFSSWRGRPPGLPSCVFLSSRILWLVSFSSLILVLSYGTVRYGRTCIIPSLRIQADNFNTREKVFGFPPTEYTQLLVMKNTFDPFYKLWTMCSDYEESTSTWLTGPFLELDSKTIETDINNWWRQSLKMSKALRDDAPTSADVAKELRERTTNFRKNLPVIQRLASPALRDRHWDQLSENIGQQVQP
jgi:hypothetical protein